MTPQHIIVIVLLAAAVAYAAYRMWKAFHPADKENPACVGCPLKENCQKRNKGEEASCNMKNERNLKN